MNKHLLEHPEFNSHNEIGAHVRASCTGGVDGRPAHVNLHLRASADDRSLVWWWWWGGVGVVRVKGDDTDSVQEKQVYRCSLEYKGLRRGIP